MMAGLSQQPRFVWSQEGPKGIGMPDASPFKNLRFGTFLEHVLMTVHVT